MRFPDYHDNSSLPEKPTAIDQDTIRITIGLLGISLPFLLLAGLYVYGEQLRPLSSISHYYYTRASPAFTITLGALAIVLLAYKGKRLVDFWLSAVAGIGALMVVLFPTNMGLKGEVSPPYYITTIVDNDFRNAFHFAAAGTFLCCLAAMSYFRFPEDDSSNEHPNQFYRVAYRTCGVVMVSAMVIIVLGVEGVLIDQKWFAAHSGIFWGEAVAVWAFGYSWLLKASFFSKVRSGIETAMKNDGPKSSHTD